MAAAVPYPVRVDASLDPPLSRWLWLVKWLLAIPHFVVLGVLWVAFVVLSVVAFFAILFTGHYPRSLFEFNVGVLRWTWRVQYYTYGALATDRYPPFTLGDVRDYPAHLDVAYPERLSRGLALVKWWLLAIPHYVLVGLFVGGGTWAAWRADDNNVSWAPGGLIGVLVLIAAVVLLFTGRYPQQLYDFVLGLNRWVLRVAAYAGLMTDDYPPFRLDMGGNEPGGTLTVPSPPAPAPTGGLETPPTTGWTPPAEPRGRGWTTGRVVSVVAGSLAVVVSLGLLAVGGVTLWADRTQRNAAGYLSLGTETFSTDGYALASDRIHLYGLDAGRGGISGLIGSVRLDARTLSGSPVFVGVAPADAVDSYLSGVHYTAVTDIVGGGGQRTTYPGHAPASPPAAAQVWVASASGAGTQSLLWKPESGVWRVVTMNADATPGLTVRTEVSARFPALPWVATGLLAAGLVLLALGTVAVSLPVSRASRT